MFGKNKIYGTSDFTSEDTCSITGLPFYTIQGEGPYAGRPAIFIRYSKCCLACSWCDTEFDKQLDVNVDELAETVRSMSQAHDMYNPLIVITGGEPLIHTSITALTSKLHELIDDVIVQIETSGVQWQEMHVDTVIVCSPKLSFIHKEILSRKTHYKFIVSTSNTDIDEFYGLPRLVEQGVKSDRKPIVIKSNSRDFIKHVPRDRIFVSPVDEYGADANMQNLKLVGDIVMRYGYTASLQMHKYLEVE